jgi:transcriptional antiterminator RfaH
MYWAVARVRSEVLALNCLGLLGFETYLPRLRTHKTVHGRPIERRPGPPLFPGYLFCLIKMQPWYEARWCPGTLGLIMDGDHPARLPQSAIDEIRKREINGLIQLARQGIARGDRVRILRGPFEGHLAIFHDSLPKDRIAVLLQMLGGEHRATLAALDAELVK